MNPSCRFIRSRLAGFAGEDLPANEMALLRAHLRDCNRCRSEAGVWLRAHNALRAALFTAAPGVDEAFFAGLHAKVHAAVALQEPPNLAPTSRVRRWLPRASGAIAALGLFALGLWMTHAPGVGFFGRRAIEPGSIRAEDRAADGSDAALRQLGFEETVGAQGMMGRVLLRTLEQEWELEPFAEPEKTNNAAAGALPGATGNNSKTAGKTGKPERAPEAESLPTAVRDR